MSETLNSINQEVVIELSNISKTYKINERSSSTIKERLRTVFSTNNTRHIHALQDINLKIHRGETIGIIGRNGSGKSSLLNIIMGSIPPNRGGRVVTHGKIMRLALGMGVDPNLSARDNIYVNASILGLSFKEIGTIFHDIISFAGLEQFIDTPVKKYSSGMRQRLMFSIAVYAKADIFLLDEFFGGTGDDDFRQKSDQAFKEKILAGHTIVIVSHSMAIIKKYCTRVVWIHQGKMMYQGEAAATLAAYKNYFESLKQAKPNHVKH